MRLIYYLQGFPYRDAEESSQLRYCLYYAVIDAAQSIAKNR